MTTARPLISPFKEIRLGDRPSVGGKGASLGELTAAGIPVPPGFVVTTEAFNRFLGEIDAEGSIRAAVTAVDAENLEAVQALSAEACARICQATLPADLAAALNQAYAGLAAGGEAAPVAVRSSATSEDSEEASFAGLQETFLWVSGEDSLAQYLRECWASLYSVESVTYRRRLDLPEEEVAMGVVVQRMVASECSGVMFTRSPTSGDRSVITIEACWGLGSALVSGEVTPDKFVVNKVTGEIVGRAVSEKLTRHDRHPDHGGVLESEVAAELRTAACLDDDQLAALAAIGKRVEKHYGSPQDIEWAIGPDGGGGSSILLLQSRPETVWAAREAKPVAKPKDKAFHHVLSALSGGRS